MNQSHCEFKIETKIQESQRDLSIFQSQGSSNPQQQDLLNEGKWSDEENLKFVFFITLNKEIFKSKEKRKAQKIFKNLAVFLETRNARQCRSHFQKAMKKFTTIIKMKNFHKRILGEKVFQAKMEQHRPQIEKINFQIRAKEAKSYKGVEAEVQTDPVFIGACQSIQQVKNWPIAPPQQFIWIMPNFL